jgi:hypothetical protein
VELSEAQLESFIALYEKKFGIALTKSEAQQKALRLLQYVLLCVKPLAKVNNRDINKMPDLNN